MYQVSHQSIEATEEVMDNEEAVAVKMKLIHPKLFGLFCPVKYTLVEKRKVYVPYEFFVFSYELRRGKHRTSDDKLGIFDRKGEIGVVFDMNEVHSFHFDLYDTLDLQTIAMGDVDGTLLPPNCTSAEAEAKTAESVRWKMLRKVFQALPQITLIKHVPFYRPAWELKLSVKSRTFEKFAYMDKHSTKNEHISGLKVRLAT